MAQHYPPVLIEDFKLDHITEGMKKDQVEAYYKGFSKCFNLMNKAVSINKEIPGKRSDPLSSLIDTMILILDDEHSLAS